MRKLIVIIIALIIIGGGSYFAFNQYQIYNNFNAKIQNTEPQTQIVQSTSTAEVTDQKILDQLKTIILLPDDVIPTMAIITDINVLKSNQPVFFAKAKNGDRVIIYPDLAIIYDYETNKIINIGPVQTLEAKPTATTSKK